MTVPDERRITEAEYAAWAEWRMRDFADDLNERYAAILPPGVRFEWTTTEDPK